MRRSQRHTEESQTYNKIEKSQGQKLRERVHCQRIGEPGIDVQRIENKNSKEKYSSGFQVSNTYYGSYLLCIFIFNLKNTYFY